MTEVKEQLASDLALREKELAEEKAKAQDVNAQMELLKGRYQIKDHEVKFHHMPLHREAGEELQMAEVKLAMHKEMLGKDEVGFGAIFAEIKLTMTHSRRSQSQTRSQTITNKFQGLIE